jgi:hypothetical protein
MEEGVEAEFGRTAAGNKVSDETISDDAMVSDDADGGGMIVAGTRRRAHGVWSEVGWVMIHRYRTAGVPECRGE